MTENIIIIGGGVAGLSAAVYAGRAGLKPLVIAGSPPGGQLTLTTEVENYPGFESILGTELVAKIRNQAVKFGARIVNENVKEVEFSDSMKTVFVQRQSLEKIGSKSVIIATGAKALWLNLPSEQRLRGKGVSACATCDGFFFKNKRVAVVGGGDTALEEALTLTKFAEKVYLIHRRDFFRASKIMQNRVFSNKKIEIIFNTAVEEIIGEKRVEGIRLKKIGIETGQEDRSKKLEKNPTSRIQLLNGVFVAIGHKPDTDLFKEQVELDEHGYIITASRLAFELIKIKDQKSNIKNDFKINYLKLIENWKLKIENYRNVTSISGVFAAGDCADPYYRQAATAAGTGVEAALEVERYLET